jgi:hypothetical protein
LSAVFSGRLVLALVLLFTVTVVVPFVPWLLGSSPPEELLEYAKSIASMEMGLLGAAITFYYSSHTTN